MSECFVTVGLIIVGIIAAFGIWEAITPSKVKDDGFFGYEDGYDDMYDDYIKMKSKSFILTMLKDGGVKNDCSICNSWFGSIGSFSVVADLRQ
jgi:hypothetical protein